MLYEPCMYIIFYQNLQTILHFYILYKLLINISIVTQCFELLAAVFKIFFFPDTSTYTCVYIFSKLASLRHVCMYIQLLTEIFCVHIFT